MHVSSRHLIVAILLLSAALRIYGLADESLWLDEGYTARRATSSFYQLAVEFVHETQTVLYFVGIRVWSAMFGTSEFALRLPSAILGVAATYGLFLLGRELFSSATGLWAALIMALNPFAIFYSQEARPYSLFLTASVFSLFFLLRMMRKLDVPSLLYYVVTTCIAMYTHPLAPLLLAVHAGVWLIYRRDPEYPAAARNPWHVVGAMIIAAALYLPQLLIMWGTIVSKTQGTSRANWIPVPDLSAFLLTGKCYFMTPVLAALAFLILFGGLFLLVRDNRKSRRGMSCLLMLVLGSVVAPWLISKLLTPVYVDRYTIPALAAILIAIAWVFTKLLLRLRIPVVAIFLGLNIYILGYYYTRLDKEPWRETAQFITNIARPGDLVVLNAAFTRDVFVYYFPSRVGNPVIAPWSPKNIPPQLDTAARIFWVDSYNAERQPSTPDLVMRVTANRQVVLTKNIDGRWPRNPWAYWAPDIRVTIYDRVQDRTDFR